MKKQNVILWGTGNYGASKYLKEIIISQVIVILIN